MSIDVVMLVVCTAFVLAGVAAVPAFWRHPIPRDGRIPGGWPWGERGWLAFQRAYPTFALALFLAMVAVVPAVLAGNGGRAHIKVWNVATWVKVIAVLGAFAFLPTAVLAAYVGIAGRPAFLVPPHLRKYRRVRGDWHGLMPMFLAGPGRRSAPKRRPPRPSQASPRKGERQSGDPPPRQNPR